MYHVFMLFSLHFLSSALSADLILLSLYLRGIERYKPLVSFRLKMKLFFLGHKHRLLLIMFCLWESSSFYLCYSTGLVLILLQGLLKAEGVSRWSDYCIVSVNCQMWKAEFTALLCWHWGRVYQITSVLLTNWWWDRNLLWNHPAHLAHQHLSSPKKETCQHGCDHIVRQSAVYDSQSCLFSILRRWLVWMGYFDPGSGRDSGLGEPEGKQDMSRPQLWMLFLALSLFKGKGPFKGKDLTASLDQS